jgi:hypothetical protein
MTLSNDTKNRLKYALARGSAADELEQHLGYLAGTTYYVDSTHASDADAGTRTGTSPAEPFSTLDYAIGRASASKGDTIVLMPGHIETTTAIALDVAGVRIIGLGYGRNRPTLTATTGASDLISVSAANCEIHNVRLVGAASGNTALLNIAAADFTARNVSFEPAAIPLMSVTAAAGSARASFYGCQWVASANGPDSAIDIETSDSDDWILEDCLFNASGFGWDLGVIRANADTARGWQVKNCTFISCDTVAIDFNSSASVADGVVEDCTFIATAALTSIEDIIDVGGYLFKECYAHDGTNATTAAARVPLGTVS